MKHWSLVGVAAVVAACALVVSASAGTARNPPSFVFGSGSIGSTHVDVNASFWPFGGVKGFFRVNAGVGFLHVGFVDCLRVTGKTAVLAGRITRSDNPAVVGRGATIVIEDNRGGVDRVGVAFNTGTTCTEGAAATLHPLVSGDFRVNGRRP